MSASRDARPLWVDQQFTWAQGSEGSIDVHGILVTEVQHVHRLRRTQLPAHPLNAEVVGHLRPLCENVLPDAGEVGRVEYGFELSCHEVDLVRGGFGPLLIVKLVTHLWFGGCHPLSTLSEIIFDQCAEWPLLEEATSPRHGCFYYGVSEGDQYVSWHGCIQLAWTAEVRGDYLAVKVAFVHFRPAHCDSFCLQNLCKVIQLLGALSNQLFGELLSGFLSEMVLHFFWNHCIVLNM